MKKIGDIHYKHVHKLIMNHQFLLKNKKLKN